MSQFIVKSQDLVKEYQKIGSEIDQAVKRVFTSGSYILGAEVDKFEQDLKTFIGTKYATAVASGTDALTLAIKALGLGRGDGVVVPANVYPTVFGVALAGVDIQLSDVNPLTLNIDVESLKKAVRQNTKAIVVVHLYGNPVDLYPIQQFAKSNNLFLIEDCAQAIGAVYDNKKVGVFSDVSCFSFYPTKNLGAYGDGGAILTNKQSIYEAVKLLRMYGEKERYNSIIPGHNSRLDELQAAVLSVKIKHLNAWNKRRNRIAVKYGQMLKSVPVETIKTYPKGKSNHHLYVIKVEAREKLIEYLASSGVSTGVHYPVPIHLCRSFSYLGYKKGSFPVSEKASREVLSIPVHPFLFDQQVEAVGEAIVKYFKEIK